MVILWRLTVDCSATPPQTTNAHYSISNINTPGKTLDPTKVADDFYNSGFDVVMSGIDPPRLWKKAAEAGKNAKYVHYDYPKGCEIAPGICLGLPDYNCAVPDRDAVEKAMAGTYTSEFVLAKPD